MQVPDDNKTEVTEQSSELIDDGITEAMDAFNEADDSEEKSDDFEETEEESKKEVKEEVEEKTEDSEESEEVDEDEKRGQEIIDKEAQAEKDAKEAEEAERKRIEAEEAEREAKETPPSYSNEDIKVFHGVVPDARFPEIALIGDVEYPLREYVTENPEIKTVSTIVSKMVVDTLINNKYIPSFQVMQAEIASLREEIGNQRFLDKVTSEVPKAVEIRNSKDFQGWEKKQPEKVQALIRSTDPMDHVRLFKRFLNAQGLDAAGKKVTEIDRKRADAKAKADAIYKTTVRSKTQAKPGLKTLSPEDEARAGFEEDDDK